MAIFKAIRPAGCFADILNSVSLGAGMIRRMDARSRV
jgi:hypothetical protein